jgi:hypothetical protein
MHWSAAPGAGFTQPDVRPWLPVGRHREHNVADQRDDADSVLSLVRDLVALRRSERDLGEGEYRSLPSPEGVWAWRRGSGTIVAVNLSDEPAALDGVEGRVRIGTRRDRDGEALHGRVELAPWEGIVA